MSQETFQQIGTRVGALVEEKNQAYGSSFSTAGAALQLLYPNGIQSGQMCDALLIARIWDKLMRIATHRDALGENPYQDILGYGILGVALHQQEEQAPCPGSVRRPDAIDPSKAQPASAAYEKRPLTTMSDDASSNETKWPWQSGFSGSTSASASTSTSSAHALNAVVCASAKEAVLFGAHRRFLSDQCGICGSHLASPKLTFLTRQGEVCVCGSLGCNDAMWALAKGEALK